MKFEELTVGRTAKFQKPVTEADVMTFAEVTGDFNPVHVDEAAAAKTRFGGRIAHGMLSAGFVSAAIGNKLPGAGSIYLGQTLRFTLPVRRAAAKKLRPSPKRREVRSAKYDPTSAPAPPRAIVKPNATVLIRRVRIAYKT